jgi:serine/threonine protein phosphatase PrpC
MALQVATLSEPGGRPVNEDCIGTLALNNCLDGTQGTAHLLALADGLGGHGSGEVASQLAIQQALDAWASGTGDATARLSAGFMAAQERVLAEQRERNQPDALKTTMVLACTEECEGKVLLTYGHIGDSRLYVCRKGKVVARTLDHSVCQMLVATGEIKDAQIRHHEDRNRLLRVIGIEWTSPRFELAAPLELEPGDSVLLACDGWWEWIEDKDIAKSAKRASSAQEWLDAMHATVVKAADKAGVGDSRDNCSAVVARF